MMRSVLSSENVGLSGLKDDEEKESSRVQSGEEQMARVKED